jgi:hypothetical protein
MKLKGTRSYSRRKLSGRHRRTRKDNIKVQHKELGFEKDSSGLKTGCYEHGDERREFVD